MTTFLSTFAERHFHERPKQSLLAGLASRLDERNLLQALASGCRPLQHLAWQKLATWDESAIHALVERALQADAPELPPVLIAVSHESIPVTDELVERIAALLESPRAEVRLAAARAVALKQPLAAIPLLRQTDLAPDRNLLRMLCLADDPSLVVPLMTAFGFPNQSPPPTIGFDVTPEWLGENHAREPQVVEWLIRNCGYCENGLCDARDAGEAVSRETLNLLSSGFSHVTARMTSEPRMTKIAHRWQRRIRAFVWRLLPDELGLLRDDDKPLDANDPFEIELFLAAVRDSDRSLFLEQKSWPPFDRRLAKREPSPSCFHASTRHLRRTFIEQPLAQADQWNIALEQRGDFLIDAARVLLEPNEEARTAAELARRWKWLPRRTGSIPDGLPVFSSSYQPSETDERLSPGADSVKNLAAACGFDWRGIADWLAAAEANWSRCLVPIGIEVQIPKVDPDVFTLAKDSLRLLGIPSPHRPEFGGMVEAAFRPARSFHAMVLGPLLLARLGIIAQPQDMALHISLQGEVDDRVRFLAFPHLFIHPSERHRHRPDRSMARVMSKGLVHGHDDAEAFDFDTHHTSNSSIRRTELRLFRLFADVNKDTTADVSAVPSAERRDNGSPIAPPTGPGCELQHRIELSASYVSDIVAVHILGSALLGSCPGCHGMFDDYAVAVAEATHELGAEFELLLNSNYFESTGDPRDEALLNLLPLFRRWQAVRESVRTRDLSRTLDLQFRRLRNRHVWQVLTHLSAEHDLSSPELCLVEDEFELVLPPSVV